MREPLAAHLALTRRSPSLILLQSYGDASLSRASLGASRVRLTLGSTASTVGWGESKSHPYRDRWATSKVLLTVNIQVVISAAAFEISPQ